MHEPASNRALAALAALTALAALIPGCGDPIACPGPIAVVIQSPTAAVRDDGDAVAPGVQADVRVRTTLPAGAPVTLEVATPAGELVGTTRGEVDADGAVVLAGITLPAPRAVLRARGDGGDCGAAEDEVTIDVIEASGCAIAVAPAPRPSAYYAPLGVLIAVDDAHPAPGLQATLAVAARPGAQVELFEAIDGVERSIGTYVADALGAVETPRTFTDGAVALRAVCREAAGAPGSASAAPEAAATTFIVDTEPPRCGFSQPFPGSSITRAYDRNADPNDGVQLDVAARVEGDDVLGEPVALSITPPGGAAEVLPAPPVDAAGRSAVSAVLAPSITPAGFGFSLAVHDHAGNLCGQAVTFEVIDGGCDIAVAAPLGPVTADADADPSNGSQLDVDLLVSPACAGRVVTSECGANNPVGVVPASGALALRVDACATSPCEGALACTFHVTAASGVATAAATALAFDDQGPPAAIELVRPAVVCGAVVSPSIDADPAAPGVQVVARVAAPGSVTRAIEQTSVFGTATIEAAADAAVTLAPGVNRLVGVAHDALGNRGQGAPCDLTLGN